MESIRIKEEIMFNAAAAAVATTTTQNVTNELQKTKRGSLQLWQFLLQLLSSKDNSSIIEWTKKNAAEFKLLDPEEVRNPKNLLLKKLLKLINIYLFKNKYKLY